MECCGTEESDHSDVKAGQLLASLAQVADGSFCCLLHLCPLLDVLTEGVGDGFSESFRLLRSKEQKQVVDNEGASAAA